MKPRTIPIPVPKFTPSHRVIIHHPPESCELKKFDESLRFSFLILSSPHPFPDDRTLMARTPLVSFVIATHNRGEVLIDCLRRTLSCGLPADQIETIVVDNASTDNTPIRLTAALPQVHLISLSQNRGAVAKNYGMFKARGEFIVVLDDDAFPQPGAIMQMIRHFRDDKNLGAAVFDVTLPDGAKEASAFPDVCIGAGTGFRRTLLRKIGYFPAEFFMQAEEYDLSFRILQAGFSVQRFWDMPLTHLKTPGARIGQRTTRLDVRNNLYLLARYVPEPLCHAYAADWLARYWMMALDRDADQPPHAIEGTHRNAFLRGSAEGMAKWRLRHEGGRRLLSPETLEQIFKINEIHQRLGRAQERLGLRRILFAGFGKNLLAYYSAARSLNLNILAVVDDQLGRPAGDREYRGIPLVTWKTLGNVRYDAVIVSNLSPVAAPRHTEALRRVLDKPVLNLFEKSSAAVQGPIHRSQTALH